MTALTQTAGPAIPSSLRPSAMPLNPQSLLISQGWSGKGNGLRKGAISKPIAVSQKRNLGGLGKEKDEAFPFWDHLFTAASKAITVKIDNSDSESDSDETRNDTEIDTVVPNLRRTTTGILSNRRPVNLITPSSSSLSSGTATPDSYPPPPSSSQTSTGTSPKMSLMALAKREAAKRHLYSKFYRAAIMAPDGQIKATVSVSDSNTATSPSTALTSGHDVAMSLTSVAEVDKKKGSNERNKKGGPKETANDDDEKKKVKKQQRSSKLDGTDSKLDKRSSKKRKPERNNEEDEAQAQEAESESESKAQRRERKRRKRGEKEVKLQETRENENENVEQDKTGVVVVDREERKRRKKERKAGKVVNEVEGIGLTKKKTRTT